VIREPKPVVVLIEGKAFVSCSLSLDNCRFVRCRFLGVELLYSGGPWSIEECEFASGCSVLLQGAAARTEALQNWLARGGMSQSEKRAEEKKIRKDSAPR
jgi:hypothetical protein